MSLDYYRNPENVYNVMFLDDDPEQCARWHCDAHVGKGLLWAAQILSQAWFNCSLPARPDIDKILTLEWSNDKPAPYGQGQWQNAQLCKERIYFKGHNDHPCVGWAGQLGGNYTWLYRLACALQEEHELRFRRVHSTKPVVASLELLPPQLIETEHQWCDAPIVLPSEFSDYKQYYRSMNKNFRKYTNRDEPEWLYS